MFLTRNITPEVMSRHRELIREFFRLSAGSVPFEAKLAGVGVHKGVYKIHTPKNDYLVAAALSLDQNEPLLEEYVILNYLYGDVPNLFPRPVAHHRSPNGLGDLIAMEYLDMPDFEEFKRQEPTHSRHHRKLAYWLGRNLAEVVIKSGRYSSEPHDGNILVAKNGEDITLKFCDAAQFLSGSLIDQVATIFRPSELHRYECIRFPHLFKKGMMDALIEVDGQSEKDAASNVDFMKEYSSIL